MNSKKTKKKYYSQYKQDYLLEKAFFNDLKNGVFIDIGAHDGISLSNTYWFENKGWSGICIEPNPTVFKQLKKNRKCICVNACISDIEKTIDFLKIEGYSDMLSGILNKYTNEHIERIDREIKEKSGKKEIIKVPAKTLNNISKENKITHITYLSIDTEGNELDILQNIDFQHLKVDLITIENNNHTSFFGLNKKDKKIKKYLHQNKFQHIYTIGCDEIYIHKKSKYYKNKLILFFKLKSLNKNY